MSVKLKAENLTAGRKSLFLDIYINEQNFYRRGLKLYLVPEKNKEDKIKNKETIKYAESLRSQCEIDLLHDRFAKTDPQKKYGYSFLKYFNIRVERENENGRKVYGLWHNTERHLLFYCNNKLRFDEINEFWLDGFKKYLMTKVSTNTVTPYLNKVKRVIHESFHEGLIPNNPATVVRGLPKAQVKKEFLTIEELIKITKAECRNPLLKKAFLFSCLSGLRWSDIHKIKWKDVIKTDEGYDVNFVQQKTKNYQSQPINGDARRILGERGDTKI